MSRKYKFKNPEGLYFGYGTDRKSAPAGYKNSAPTVLKKTFERILKKI